MVLLVTLTAKGHSSSNKRGTSCDTITVYVDEQKGQKDCCNQYNNETYKTLVTALDCTENCSSTTVEIKGNITLNTSIHEELGKRKNVTIKGDTKDKTHIVCGLFNSSSIGSGLALYNLQNVTLSDLTFINCGSLIVNKNKTVYKMLYRSAIHMWACSDVTISNVHVKSSNGIGLEMFDMKGHIIVVDSSFTNNTLQIKKYNKKNVYGGGGVYIRMTKAIPAMFNILNCTFKNNNKSMKPQQKYTGPAGGGGLMVYFRGNNTRTIVNIINCTVSNNKAKWGGGLYIGILQNASNNYIYIKNTTMSNNWATHSGGGLTIVFQDFEPTSPPRNTSIVVENSMITNNIADYGGGSSISSRQYQYDLNNSINFTNCTWLRNKAYVSAAAFDVAQTAFNEDYGGITLHPEFVDCKFENNSKHEISHNKHNARRYSFNFGIFCITTFEVIFRGETVFSNNKETALQVNFGSVHFKANSKAKFINNYSKSTGGALALLGISNFGFENNSIFVFDNNKAHIGGAIYVYSRNQHDYLLSRSCFIKYYKYGERTCNRNTSFIFSNNKAISKIGNAIYASTLKPCNQSCSYKDSINCPRNNKSEQIFNCCVGNFTFIPEKGNHINTLGYKIKQGNKNITAFPGKTIKLKHQILDETNKDVTAITTITLYRKENDSEAEYSSNGEITVYGEENSKTTIRLETDGLRILYAIYSITLSKCPPGYSVSVKKKECKCLSDKFEGIQCNSNKDDYSSFVSAGTWVGYNKNELLLTSSCPNGYCDYTNVTHEYNEVYKLPITLQPCSLCTKGRKGILCGKCLDGYSVRYHSEDYRCKKDSNQCTFGILMYIMTELLPVTVIFLLIIICNISFTSGALNSFILFAQIANFHSFNHDNYTSSSKILTYIMKGQRFIYGLFNLQLDIVEHCLWKGATTLDVLAMKYVAVVYSLALVMGLVFIFNCCSCTKIHKLCAWQRRSFHSSVIHGISAFLVMCYTQCARTTILILQNGSLKMEGPKQYKGKVVYMSGGMNYFGDEHLIYAIPAIFFLVFFVALPPVILVINSITTQVMIIINRRGVPMSTRLINSLLMIRLKPLLDSFQGCFRDKCRSFAGIYFIYRALLSYDFRLSSNFFTSSEILFVGIICLHAVTQPYKTKWHNIADILLFTDLTMIKIMSVHLRYYDSKWIDKSQNSSLNIFKWMQAFLLYFPILYVLFYGMYSIKKRKCEKDKADDGDVNEWPSRLLNSQVSEDYGTFQN